MSDAIGYHKGPDNIVVLTLDAPGQSANTMNAAFRASMAEVVSRLEAEGDALAGVILTSAKKTFFAGGDLNELVKVDKADALDFYLGVLQTKHDLRRLEILGKPVVAAINGAALGGGWEICLACHQRILLDQPAVRIGLPEVTLGLLPGGGGVVRMVRLLGIEKALPYLLEGRKLSPAEALAAGLVQQLASDTDDLLDKGRAWIRDNPTAVQPWDQKGYCLPGGTPDSPALAATLALAPSLLRARTQGCLPAPEKILCAAVEGARVDFEAAQIIEARYFTELVTGQVAKNMIGTFWFQLNQINAGHSRPAGHAPSRISRIGVIGAGMMGAGIAHVAALAGIEVVLKDLTLEAVQRARTHSRTLLERDDELEPEQREQILARIEASDSYEDFQRCELIIEAVFEDRHLKAEVSRAAVRMAPAQALIASNTSTLPISGLAEAVAGAGERFIGLHFFSPVERMPLVEIIRGKHTSDATLAKAFDFVLQLGKTPIVVNDSRGFFTSRVFATYTNEGIAMLGEGVPAAMIENQARQAGMPVGPLAVSDEVSLSLMRHIRRQTEADFAEQGSQAPQHPAFAVIDRMLDGCQRPGKAAGGGFYDYPAGAKKHLWDGLASRFGKEHGAIAAEDIRDRLLFIQALETVRCLEEGVLQSVADANLGSVFGIGFASWTGGALQFINQYGLPAFVVRARELARAYGERFEPPALLLEKAADNVPF